ncbi:MAG: pyruvate kinase [Vulcanimicrobiota bacterium]
MSLEKPHIRLKIRRTKIVATVGPSSDTPEVLKRMILAGVDVFRLNMSHGTHEGHREVYGHIRRLAEETGRTIAVLADLCGPKIRTGRFQGGGIDLIPQEKVVVTTRKVLGEPGLIPTIYQELPNDVVAGDRIFLNDGLFELQVEGVEGSEVSCRVVRGGYLTDRKGINLPGVAVSAPALTAKDREDVVFALELGVDLIALSFVRRAEEVEELRRLVSTSDNPPYLVSKIEKPEALKNIDSILQASDAVMVARGDLGVELPPEEVPVIQDQLLTRAREFHRPVIVATQMLESMVDNQRPTRAEVSDVSRAVNGGADAVMLSAETAAGAHPVESVEMMDRVARETENYLWQRDLQNRAYQQTPFNLAPATATLSQIFSTTVADLSRELLVRAVVVLSRGRGTSATTLSSARPAAPVVALSRNPRVCCWMSLLWGVLPHHVKSDAPDSPHEMARRLPQELGLATPGGYVLEVGGFSEIPEANIPTISVLKI